MSDVPPSCQNIPFALAAFSGTSWMTPPVLNDVAAFQSEEICRCTAGLARSEIALCLQLVKPHTTPVTRAVGRGQVSANQ